MRLLGVAVLEAFFLGSALDSERFLFPLEVARVDSVSDAFALLAGFLACIGSAAGLRELRRLVVVGASSAAFSRLAALPDLVFAGSTGAAVVPERVRDRVAELAAGVASASRALVRPDLGLGVVVVAVSVGSGAFGVTGAVPR